MREFGIACNFIPHGAGYAGTRAPAFQILDDVFRVGGIVFVTDRIDVDFSWLRFIASSFSKPTQHGVFIVVVV
jgi:hypothetical protein